jgi:hypothetical protein
MMARLKQYEIQSMSALVLSFQYVQCQSTCALVPKPPPNTKFKFRTIVMLWEFPSATRVYQCYTWPIVKNNLIVAYPTMINGESHNMTARGQP